MLKNNLNVLSFLSLYTVIFKLTSTRVLFACCQFSSCENLRQRQHPKSGLKQIFKMQNCYNIKKTF